MIDDIGLRPVERQFADQLVRYLLARGVDEARYWIGPGYRAASGKGDLVANYDAVLTARGDTRTALMLPFAGGTLPLVAGFSDVTTLMMHSLSEPGAWDELRALDISEDDEHLLQALDINPTQACRPSVKAWAEGTFLAPDGEGYTYFLVEPRGALSVIATSPALAPVAWAYAADRRIDASNLPGRIAKAAPIR